MSRHIVWTEEEVDQIATAIYARHRGQPVDMLHETRVAQKQVLPSYRQRTLRDRNRLEKVDKAYARLKHMGGPRPTPQAPVPPEIRVISKPTALEDALIAMAQKAMNAERTADHELLLSKVRDAVRIELASVLPKFVAEVRAAITSKGDTSVTVDRSTVVAPTPPKPRAPRPKVLIIGLLNEQVHIINNEYEEMLDLRFIKSNDGISQTGLIEKCRDMDVVMVMIKFVGHGEDRTAKQVAKRYIPIHGGMSSLKDVLDDVALKSGTEAARHGPN